MSMTLRPLRGQCQCGRNRYKILVPPDSVDQAQVLFNTESAHQTSLGTPLPAYIRVPLSWYQSATYAYCPDETHTTIRKLYTPRGTDECKRYFCGYCGTQLSYWSESPATEADFIQLTLGSLLREDLHDLGEMGLIPDDDDDDDDVEGVMEQQQVGDGDQGLSQVPVLRQTFGVPWFDDLVQGTKLGRMRCRRGGGRSQDGRMQVEWEVVEYSGSGEEDEDEDVEMTTGAGKRKLGQREEDEVKTN